MAPASRTPGLLAPLFIAGVCVLWGLLPELAVFSDGVQLQDMVERRPAPYYNAAYVPLGWSLHRSLEPLCGWSVAQALGWLSALAVGGGLLACLGMLRGRGARAGERLLWVALLAVAPGLGFHANVLEVHALQFTGAALATWIAVRAGRARGQAAATGLAYACTLALLFHLTHALLLPGLLVLALGRDALRPGPLLRGVLSTAVVAGATLFSLWGLTTLLDGQRGAVSAARTLPGMASYFTAALSSRGFFSLREVGAFVLDEYLLAWGALGLIPLSWAWLRTRAAAAASLVFAAHVLVIAQSGIREQGGYGLSLLPLLALTGWEAQQRWARTGRGARLLPLAAGLALMASAALSARTQHEQRVRVPLWDWRERVVAVCGPEAHVITASLPRYHALSYGRRVGSIWDVRRDYETTPRARWDQAYARSTVGALRALEQGRPVYVDADVVRQGARDAGLEEFLQRLEAGGVRLAPRPAEAPEPLLYRVVLPARSTGAGG